MIWLFWLPLLTFIGVFAAFEIGALVARYGNENERTSTSPLNGAIYALLGLLVAFSFSGAYQRFYERSHLTVEESIRIQDMANILELLPTADALDINAVLVPYLQSRIDIYAALPDVQKAMQQFHLSRLTLQQLQSAVYEVVGTTADRAISSQLLTRMAALQQIEARRMAATHAHPPSILFLLMTAMALIVSFLAGHDHGNNMRRPLLQTSLFAAVFAATTWIIVDMEYPRLGLLIADRQDQLLVDLLTSFKSVQTVE
jgi:hypothetical protein